MTTHADGVYWVKWKDGDGIASLIEKHGRCWSTFGTADYYIDDYVNEHMTIVAGPLRPPQYAAPKLTPIPADDPRAVALRAAIERSEATLCWDGSSVSVELTCGHCGHTELYDGWVARPVEAGHADPIECKKCRRLWRPSRVVSCELVTDAEAIAKFRREYYGEGR